MQLIDLDEVKRRVSLEGYLTTIGAQLIQHTGSRCRSTCPACGFADERACSIDLVQGCWKCHRCGRSGDVLDWHAHKTTWGFRQSVISLCRVMGVEVPYVARSKERRTRKPRKQEQELDFEEEHGVK